MDGHYDYCSCGKIKKKQSKVCASCYQPYARTAEHRKKTSDRSKGISQRGYGWKHSLKTRQKMRDLWTPEKKEAARLRGLKSAQDPNWRLRCGSPADKNPNWNNGNSQIPYAPGWAKKVKQIAWEKANYHCEICQSDKPLDTHHIDFQKDNHNLENLQVLCRKCHKKLHAEHLLLKKI